MNYFIYLHPKCCPFLPSPHRVLPLFPQFASKKVSPWVSLLLGLSHHQNYTQAGLKSQHICSRGLPCLDSVGEDIPNTVET